MIWTHKSKSPLIRQAYRIWSGQRCRCNNPFDLRYKNYGAKGIKVEYGSREFIKWWCDNISTQEWKSPTCGRIDHSKNYCFENIEIQERSDNTRERNSRVGIAPMHEANKRKIALINEAGMDVIYFDSIAQAKKLLRLDNVCRAIKLGIRDNGFRFRYVDNQQGGLP